MADEETNGQFRVTSTSGLGFRHATIPPIYPLFEMRKKDLTQAIFGTGRCIKHDLSRDRGTHGRRFLFAQLI
jgi:hypothetical protein